MAQVGVESLTAGDTQHHSPQDYHAVQMVSGKKVYGIDGIQGPQDIRSLEHLDDAEGGQGAEPDQHDGTEDLADALGAMALKKEQPQQHTTGYGQH